MNSLLTNSLLMGSLFAETDTGMEQAASFPEVTRTIGWTELLGATAAAMPEPLRRQRWERWLTLIRQSDEPALADFWQDAAACEDCQHLSGSWCLDMELPCTVNPILTFRSGLIGMACMGGATCPPKRMILTREIQEAL